MPSFDSATYLRGLGWSGPGSSLNNDPSGRAKHITVVQKKTLAGVGRDRDTAFPWWEMVFSSVAGKVGGGKVEHHRTSTGILSHRPPAGKATAYDSVKKENAAGLNMDAMAVAKLEMARRQLYSGFMRGTKLSGSLEEESEDEDESTPKKRKRPAEDSDDSSSEDAREKTKKKKRSKEEKEEKRRRKEEKRAKKERKGKGKDKISTSSTSSSTDGAATTEPTSITSTSALDPLTPAESDSASAPSVSKSKLERKAAKKLAKSLLATPSATSPLPASTSSLEAALVAEELAYQEAKAAAKRAAKQEKKLAKKALQGREGVEKE